jgi:intein/homing endonuclease
MQGYTLMSVEYLAGLFDADGCASSYVQRKKKVIRQCKYIVVKYL